VLVVLGIGYLHCRFRNPAALEKANGPFFLASSLSGLLWLFCVMMRYHLTKCIHYMRVREVIYVLESAALAKRMLRSSASLSGFGDIPGTAECMECFRKEEAAERPEAGGSSVRAPVQR